GEDVVLPCYLKPNISAVDLSVEWFRVQTKDPLVHLYRDHEDRNENQIPSYRRRTSLFPEELRNGNTSLKVKNLRGSDNGEYKCLVQSGKFYDDSSIEVLIKAVGTQPVISIEGYKEGGISLVCESKGWYPQPQVVWMDSEGHSLPAGHTETHRDSMDLFIVRRRVIVQETENNRFTCRVLQEDLNEIKETITNIPGELHIFKSFEVLGPADPVVAVLGEDVVLPCYLKPNISAVDLHIEWLRVHTEDPLVHLYRDQEDRNEKQIASYRGRTSLFSEQLKNGNVSLKLRNAQVSDNGEYKCLVQSGKFYDDSSIEVHIKVVGTQPVISNEGYKEGGISLVCESKGWFPQPEVVWMDSEGHSLPAGHTETHTDSMDLFTVRQRVIVEETENNRFTCRVRQQQINEMKETITNIPGELHMFSINSSMETLHATHV
uniref:Ig-like domain-containing protein n=1 Tax=Scleropages formosus TaxID=113540 RepID=A0A8C9V9D5_SCLFO